MIRLNALAEAILDRGHDVLVKPATPGPANSFFSEAVGIIKLQSRDDPVRVVDWLEAKSMEALIS